MSDNEVNQSNDNLHVGSGDFQPNPIYGDQPPSYAPSSAVLDDDSSQSQHQAQNTSYNQHIPPSYSNENQHDNTYPDEPEDVVAQMNQHNSDEDNIDYISPPKQSDTDDSDPNNQNGYGLFGNFLIRTMYISCSIFICSLLSFSMWFQTPPLSSFNAGFGLSGFGAFLLFSGSMMAFIWALLSRYGRPIPFERIFKCITIGLYIIGGLFYFIGGCGVAYGWNSVDMSYIAGIFFAEQTFVALYGILAGADLFKNSILNDKTWRVIIYNAIFVFLSVVSFFSYAVTSTNWDKHDIDNAGPAWLTLFYFVVLIPEIIYLVIFLVQKLNDILGKPIVLLILAAVYLGSALCLLIGYFVLIGAFPSVKGRAYFLGFGLFVVLCATINAFDMMLDRFVPGYKDGGQSVGDQGVNGVSAVATHDPDSMEYD